MSRRIVLPFRPAEHRTEAPVIGTVSLSGPSMLPGRDLDRQPSVRAEAGALADLWVQACSLAGRSHTEGSSPSSGQDSYSYRLSDDGSVAVFAIADGLGSRPRSHVGAHVAAVQACASFAQPTMADLFDGPPGRLPASAAVIAALGEVQEQVIAADRSGSGRDVATTLLVALLRLGEGPKSVVFVRVGDPSALLMEGGRFTSRSLVFGQPADGPANALSGCLPLRDPDSEIEVVRVGALPEGVGVVLVTDGVGNDLRSPELREWLERRWAAPLDAPGMIDSLRYRRQGSVDDRTAVVILPTSTAVEATLPRSSPVADVPAAPLPATQVARRDDLPVRPPVDNRVARRRVHRRRRYALVGAGAAVVVTAVGVVALAAGDRSSDQALALPQWIASGQQREIVVATADGGVRLHDVEQPPAAGSVITSQPGAGVVTVSGCQGGGASRVGADPRSPDEECEPVTIAVPDGDEILVVSGGRLRVQDSGGAGWDVSAALAAIGDDAVDAARWRNHAVVVGDGDVALVTADDPNPILIERAVQGCEDAHYVAAEVAGNELALAATCSEDRWAVVGVSPRGKPCPRYAGVGDPPAPVRTPRDDLVLAVGTSAPATAQGTAALATAPLEIGCE